MKFTKAIAYQIWPWSWEIFRTRGLKYNGDDIIKSLVIAKLNFHIIQEYRENS